MPNKFVQSDKNTNKQTNKQTKKQNKTHKPQAWNLESGRIVACIELFLKRSLTPNVPIWHLILCHSAVKEIDTKAILCSY